MSIVKNDAGNPIWPTFQSPSVTDTTLTFPAAVVINVSSDLGGGTKKGNRGFLENTGTNDCTVEIATTGTAYQTGFTLRAGKNLDLTGMGISSIRLTPLVGNTTVQAVIW